MLGAEGVDVHGLADIGEGPADVLGMREEAVEVGAAESPSAEGALVDTFGEVGGVLADLQPPQDLPSLGVLLLLVAADVAGSKATVSARGGAAAKAIDSTTRGVTAPEAVISAPGAKLKRGSSQTRAAQHNKNIA